MLYQERTLGRPNAWKRLVAHLAIGLRGRKHADLDLLSMNPHLRRDLGLDDGQSGLTIR